MLCVFVPKGKLAQVHWFVSIVAGIRKLAYRFDRLGSIREERNVWCVLVLSEYLRGPKLEFSIEPLTNE